MQFKHPELLWALFLLLIPLFIHLFQLRRFKKTPFTNVKLLQKIVVESRKSNTLKKWLLLITRLLLVAALVLAFAQPFFAEETALAKKDTVIYLDDSFSMQAKNNSVSLLEDAVQDLIKSIPKENTFSLFTNEKTFKNVELKDIQNDLLSLNFSNKQLKLKEVELKASTLFPQNKESIKNLIMVSDFQQHIFSGSIDSTQTGIQKHLVQLLPEKKENVVIDSAYVSTTLPNTIELTTELSSTSPIENIPVSLYNGENLIAKTSANFGGTKKASMVFTLPKNEVIHGKIEVSDAGLAYDNTLLFTINEKEKIKVLSITQGDSGFLNRIFWDDEFLYASYSLQNLDYSLLESQNLIVLNELNSIPNSLQNALKSFKNNGGYLVVVPSQTTDLTSYNQFLSSINSTTFSELMEGTFNMTQISFSHPLYTNVFEKKVTNFQYPTVSKYYRSQSTMPNILSFENGNPFLIGENGFYVFTSSLSKDNTNFKASPLIVPTFYSMGDNSLKSPELYTILGNFFSTDVAVSLGKDNILKLVQDTYEFIPQQQSFDNKVTLTFDNNFERNGIYTIKNGNENLKNISFNHPRNESDLSYLDINTLHATSKQSSIISLFSELENDNRVTDLWKWFVILALLFILVEILIQKVFK
ncbi:hypothetical protein GGR42_000170 [Saonia flava]|uniref:Aerotolerance regulator N-terminal domain-containing protein n=1 Tax=Saonia flava TaxID=523696 RepID=A0A846QNK5_9FLAO|nr:BatA domain-containing protein [Saonia flava]NJB69708.1 hypothetical protein [Saonia flava]